MYSCANQLFNMIFLLEIDNQLLRHSFGLRPLSLNFASQISLLDNYHIVDEQIREIKDDLPPRFYRRLPKLADGPLRGYPRVFGISWAMVAHTDSAIDVQKLAAFVDAYQRVQPLTIGELWAIAITLRITLVENLRRVTESLERMRKTGGAS